MRRHAVLLVMGLTGCHLLAGFDEIDPTPAPTQSPMVSGTGASMGGAGGASMGGGGAGAAPNAKRVFVTSEEFYGDMVPASPGAGGGPTCSGVDLTPIDEICDGLAADAGLGGRWRAYIGTPAENAIDRIVGDGPWVNVPAPGNAPVVVFNEKSALAAGALATPLERDENGALVIGGTPVWTGITPGATRSDWHCGCFAENDFALLGYTGSVAATGSAWHANGNMNCDQRCRLYCFEQ
jgi:hypothetical protein